MYNWPVLFFRLPWSGDVVQDISPKTNWDLPFSADYKADDRELERKLVEDEAGYGKQLGLLLDAVDRLITELPANRRQEPCYRKLHDLAQRIAEAKKGFREETLRRNLASFRNADPDGMRRLLEEFQSSPPGG